MALPQKYVVSQVVNDSRKDFANEKLFMEVMKGLHVSDTSKAWEVAAEWEKEPEKAVRILEALENGRKEDGVPETQESLEKKREPAKKNTQKSHVDQSSSRIAELEKQVESLKDQNKKNKKTIQQNKITIDNLKKDADSMFKEKAGLEASCVQKDKEIVGLKSALDDYSKKETEYISQIAVLKEIAGKYKELKSHVPQILVFSGKEIDSGLLNEKNAVQVRSWDPNVKADIDWKKAGQLWIVSNDFSYGKRVEIQKAFGDDDNFRVFQSANALVRELNGGVK